MGGDPVSDIAKAVTYYDTGVMVHKAFSAGHGLEVEFGDGTAGYLDKNDLANEWGRLAPGETFDVTPCADCKGPHWVHEYRQSDPVRDLRLWARVAARCVHAHDLANYIKIEAALAKEYGSL